MRTHIHSQRVDVVVIGAGAAGVGAAIGAARNGATTLLVDAGPTVGGELLTGMTVDGAVNARGELVVGGALTEIIDECKAMDGFVGIFNDHRLIRYVCYDPEVMKMAIIKVMARYGVKLLLHTFAEDVMVDGGRVTGVMVRNKAGHTLIQADSVIDCSGDGDIAAMAGAPFEMGAEDGDLQPVSIMFRMSGVEAEPLLRFVRDHPEHVAVGESDAIRAGRTDKQLVESLYEQGQPCVFFKGEGPLLAEAIDRKEMFPTALIMIQPTSTPRKEVCVNSTRVWSVDPLKTDQLSATMPPLYEQVWTCVRFLQNRVPGFENAHFSAIAPRLGIRETRRIIGEYVLSDDDVIQGRKFEDGIAKGCHHIDIHGRGRDQVRIPVADGGSYDIPFRCLVAKGLDNVLVAGRCMSATRAAQGTARTMGPCLAMGTAAGTAAALRRTENANNAFRDFPVGRLRETLKSQGSIVDGTH
ncbi:MAG: FAD-dependent oxidoreductase [Rhodospirillales bacterium]|jgi:hypothetical protein|nr:FAD-dependent oxidoreductase [Rhodospirillales bacterium]